MDKERALKLAKKLAAINNSNATENEAMLAAEHLARIAAEHNITRLDWSKDEVRSNVKSETSKPYCDRRADIPRYGKMLIAMLGQKFGVRPILIGDGMVDFIGDETSVTLVKFFLEELMVAIPKLRWKAKCESGPKGAAPAWKQSWEMGFIEAVGIRMERIKTAMTDVQETNSRALVLVTKEAVDNAVAIKYPNLTQGRHYTMHRRDPGAYARGIRDGNGARLQEGIR